MAMVLTGYFRRRVCSSLNVLAVWNAAVWLLWSVLRRRRALAAVLPLAMLGALYTALSKDGAQLPVLFIAAGVLSLARTAYTYQTHEWDRRNVGFPDLIGEDWAVWAAILSAVVVLLAGISTPEWRSSFQRFIESLHPPPPPAEGTSVPVPIKPQVNENYTPSFVPSMGYVGESFPLPIRLSSTSSPMNHRQASTAAAWLSHPSSGTIGAVRSSIATRASAGNRSMWK
jgi:hypothetical protein